MHRVLLISTLLLPRLPPVSILSSRELLVPRLLTVTVLPLLLVAGLLIIQAKDQDQQCLSGIVLSLQVHIPEVPR